MSIRKERQIVQSIMGQAAQTLQNFHIPEGQKLAEVESDYFQKNL